MFALAFRTIVHFYRWLLPVAAGIAVCSAVIVGALLVGDSMRGSLRHIALDRIGQIDRIIIAPRWFSSRALGDRQDLQGLMLIDTVVAESLREQNGILDTQRATEMTLLGIDDSFWRLGDIEPKQRPHGEQVILNQSLADKLSVQVGDRVTLKVSRQAVVPADSALGKRESETVALSRWEIVDILPDNSLARFSLRGDQRPVLNAFASKQALQNILEIDGKVNAVVRGVGSEQVDAPVSADLDLKLEDMGLTWERVTRIFPDPAIDDAPSSSAPVTILDYDQLMCDQMLLNDRLVESLLEETSEYRPQRIMTYLANSAEVTERTVSTESSAGRAVPYSTISGVPWEVIERMLVAAGQTVPPPKDENWVVLNQWIAEQMQAQVGDRVRIDYFLAETVEGKEVEKAFDVHVAAIAPLTQPKTPYRRSTPARFDHPPTPFNDPKWTPEVPGITDQESISSWETPFPLDRKIENIDDVYWNEYRLTPKLFISDSLARSLFGSRFGDQTSIRYDGLSDSGRTEIEGKILSNAREHLVDMGWRDIPLRQQQLRAASGTTPFDALFLSLSFFVIAAALLLVAILFRLSIEKRADHWGLLMASGWTRSKVRRLLLVESALIAGLGATLGVLLGLAYAYAMLAGLRSWWVGAISVSFLNFYVRPQSLILGWVCGFVISLLATWFVTRQIRSQNTTRLLKGNIEEPLKPGRAGRWSQWIAIGCAALGALVMIGGQFAQGQAQAGAFVGSGMLWMMAGIFWMYKSLRSIGKAASIGAAKRPFGINMLSRSNAQRSPMRSILTIALMAMASFLILSMSLFQAQPDRRGTGQADALRDAQIVSLRMRGGDDASCNNLYQANEPQVIGVPTTIETIDQSVKGESEFAWFATDTGATSPWSPLHEMADGSQESPIPVIIDQNTALWALHLGGYVGERFAYTFGTQRVHFITVGVSQNTILQGSLWIGEQNFQRVFPEITGYRQFLIKVAQGEANRERIENMRIALEKGWADEGLSCASTSQILSRLLAVQNTYLSAFQVLGALGLLLGTLGLGATQLRGAMERRSELAAMRAMGFSKPRLVWTLALENGWQLMRGIGVGLGAALLSAAPVLWRGQSTAALASPLIMLFWVIILGLLFCLAAAVLAVRQPLLASLRSDR
ncbi:MAG: FtsX-like permease family protein [Pirellula sp.]|nr:FtsX-like permease family protein [Pirellula sp.]